MKFAIIKERKNPPDRRVVFSPETLAQARAQFPKAEFVVESSDIRVFPAKSWGSGLFYFTGSKNFNIQMRKIAIKKGYKLNEYGLFDKKSEKMIAGKTEEEICKKLGVKWVRPEERDV